MSLGALPRLTRTEAEQVAESIREKWVGMTGKSRPIISEEAWGDLIQEVYRQCAAKIEERPETPSTDNK